VRLRVALAVAAVAALAAPAAARAEAVALLVDESGARTVIRVDGPSGVLTSESTRLHGLITEGDRASGAFDVVAVEDPASTVRRLERRIEWNDRWRLPLTIVLAATVLVLAAVRPLWALRAILLGLAANLWLSPLAALAAAAAALALPLGWASAAVVAAYLAVLGLDADAVALSPLGPSQVNRFYGVNNLIATLLLVPALVGTALLRRLGVAVAAAAVVAVGGNRFGADGGGLVVLLAALAVLWLRLDDRRLTPRVALATAAAVALAALAFTAVDAATGGSSHVTASLSDGPSGLVTDVADRLEASARRAVSSLGAALVVAAGILVLVAVALRTQPSPLRDALLAALVISVLVNDTPTDVLGLGAVVAVAVARADPLLVAPRHEGLRPWFDPFVASHARRRR